jgi:hypothetical protein
VPTSDIGMFLYSTLVKFSETDSLGRSPPLEIE